MINRRLNELIENADELRDKVGDAIEDIKEVYEGLCEVRNLKEVDIYLLEETCDSLKALCHEWEDACRLVEECPW